MNRPELLQATPILDYTHPGIQALIAQRGWKVLAERERIGAIYAFVRDEIAFGYNRSDDLPASLVLADGIGQCNTKASLLMALLRACGVACRIHGFTIDKALQKGAITGIAYLLAPRNIVHSWVEVSFEGRWVNLEGFILDKVYLQQIQRRFADHRGSFRGYGVATPDLQNPPVEWTGADTYIQKDGINADLGVYASPDAFYARRGVNLSGFKRWLFENVLRHWMNRNVERMRSEPRRPCSEEKRDLLSGRLLFWLPTVTFVLHFLEELPGFALWASARFAPTSQAEFAVVHIPLIWLVTVASYRAWLSSTPTVWRFWATTFQWQFAFNAVFHLGSALVFREYVPGMVMAATIGLPATAGLTVGVLRMRLLRTRELLLAVLSGAVIAAMAIAALFV